MAGAKGLPPRLAAILAGLLAKLPFLKRALPGTGRAPEPFDSLEDGTSHGGDEFEPNVAVAFAEKAGRGSAEAKAARRETLAGIRDSLLKSPLAIAIVLGTLALLVSLLVVAFQVAAPPARATVPAVPVPDSRTTEATKNAAASSAGGIRAETFSMESAALLQKLILPGQASIEARIELERPRSPVYTVEDSAPYRTDMGKLDIEGLESRREAAIEDLYKAVP